MNYWHTLMQAIPSAHLYFDWKRVTEFLAHYVFWSSVTVNFLAGCELVCRTVEQWAVDNTDKFAILGRFALKVRMVEKCIAVVTDLVDRLGAINFKSVIRPRQNRRENDTETLTVTPPASKGNAAGS